ncbi:MAG TPA: nucleobase:cation symporter-2 family protein [Terrimicrobiaceae bacterium]
MGAHLLKLLPLGLQHVLAMYGGAVVVPLIVGAALNLSSEQLTVLISADLLTCGLASLLQVIRNPYFGVGLPVILGCTFAAVAPLILIGKTYGMQTVYGSVIVAGIVVVLIASFFGKLLRFFPPVVTGSVVTIIGMTLIPVAMTSMLGAPDSADFGSLINLFLGFEVLGSIILIHRLFKGFVRSIAVLLGIVIGTCTALLLGKVDLSPVWQASWFHITRPFYFGTPVFSLGPILTMTMVAIVSLVESSGVFLALAKICDKELTPLQLVKGYRAEGLAIVLGGALNSFPYTTFSQNVGLVQLSGVKSLNVICTAATMLVVLGFLPKIATIAILIPTAVLGGAMVAMFGMVAAAGIKMLSEVNFRKNENLLIIGCSLALGLGVSTVPNFCAALPAGLRILFDNGIVAGTLSAVLLNLFFHHGTSVRRRFFPPKTDRQR